MWAQSRDNKKATTAEDKKKKSANNSEHHYFKGHVCKLPYYQQTKSENDKKPVVWNVVLYFLAVRSGDIRTRFLFRSYSALSAEINRQYKFFPWSIHPYSRLRLAVEVLSMITIQLSFIFITHYILETEGNASGFEGFIHMCEIIYFINIIVNFFTGYIDGHSSRYVVLNVKKIAWKYIRTWFFVDLTFCLGLLVKTTTSNISAYITVTTLKILKIITMFEYVDHVMEVISASEKIKTFVNIIILVGNYLLWNMVFQFSLEYIGESTRTPITPRDCSWLTINRMWNASGIERKIGAFNRAVGMLQQNSNLNLLEQEGCFETFFVVAWRIGKILAIHCALKFMLMSIALESAEARYFILTQQLQLYMDQRRFPERIRKKIFKFYAVRFHSIYFSEKHMMDCVSGRLREDIIMHSSRQLVGEVEFLKQLPRTLLLQIGMKLKVAIFLAGDIIFKINTIGDCLYFIDKGTVAIYSESGEEICHLQDGAFFGEIALVLKPCFRVCSAVAVTNCELFRLDKIDFQSTIAVYPTVYENIIKVANQRLESTRVIDEHYKAELRSMNENPPEEM